MMVLLILAPFGCFALLMLVTSAPVSLFAAAAICLAVIAYDHVRGLQLKILGAGSAVVFGALGGYITLVDPGLSTAAVKLIVDAGVFAIALLSIAFRFPFTLQYAREMVDPETAKLPGFIKASYIITWVWTGALFAMMAANVLMIYSPSLPRISDRIRRPQQRGLFHQMVSATPTGKIRPACRRTIRFLNSQLKSNNTQGEARR